MPGAMLLILQAAAAATGAEEAPAPAMGPVLPAPPPPRKTLSLDIAARALECRAASADDIVVCAERDDARYRLQPLPELADEPRGPPRAETMLFGKVKGSIDADSAAMPDGQISKRLMLHFTLPF